MIVIINGSPNIEKGNSVEIIKRAADHIEKAGIEYKVIDALEVLMSMKTPFCTACSTPCKAACSKGTKLEEAFDIVRAGSAFLLVSPVYFGTVSAELKALWDVFRYLRYEKAFYNKPAVAAAVGASKFGGQEAAIRTMQEMMLVQGMLLAGDGYGDNMGHFGAALCKPAMEDKEGVASLDRSVLRLIELHNILKK